MTLSFSNRLYSTILALFIITTPTLSQTISWTQANNGITSLSIGRDLLVNMTDDIFVCIYNGDGILYRSTDNGSVWSEIGPPGLPVQGHGSWHIAITNTGVLYLGGAGMRNGVNYDFGIFRSSDNGNTWSQTTLDTTLVPLTITTNSNGEVFAGVNGSGSNGGIYESTDDGKNWTQVNSIFYPTKLEIDSAGDIFAGTYQDGIYRSTDDGKTWKQLNAGIPIVFAITFSHGCVFAGSASDGVFRSSDNGSTWTQINTGLTNTYVYGLVVNSAGDIFAGTYGGGVFESSDNGNTWFQENKGLNNVKVLCLALNSSQELIAGTDGGGVFLSSQTTTSVMSHLTEIPKRVSLDQNYPNPFNPSTTISYQLPTNSFVVLTLFNVLGREVKTLVNQRQNAGNHTVRLNAANLASGEYFYRIETGTYHDTKKLLLLK